MRAFLLVLVVSVLAFADAFYSLDQTVKPEEGAEGAAESTESAGRLLEDGNVVNDLKDTSFGAWFLDLGLEYIAQVEQAYLLTNGEFPLDKVGTYDKFGWGIFLLATIFNLIIMLNLLITIISEDFAAVIGIRDEYMFKERVNTIVSLQRTIGYCVKQESNPQKLIFTATELKIDEIRSNVEQIDMIADKVKEIGDEISSAHTNLDTMLADLDTTNESNAEQKGESEASPRKEPDIKVSENNLLLEIKELKEQVKLMNAQKGVSENQEVLRYKYQKK